MKRRTLPVAAALAATAALLLTACGGGSDGEESKENDKIAGADTGGGAPASATPSDTAAVADGRPKIELPSDVSDKYEGWKTGDTVKDAVLKDTAGRIDATNDAILRGDTGAPGLTFYYRDKALNGAVEWVKAYVEADLSFDDLTQLFIQRAHAPKPP